MRAREVTGVRSVRDISRLCDCRWEPVLKGRRVTGWRLALAAEACRFHGWRGRAGAAA